MVCTIFSRKKSEYIIESTFISLIEKQIIPLIDNEILPMINQQVIPLINDRMIPLIDNDISKLENSLHAIKLILEADRDLHQVLVAEKRSLAASEDEMQPVIKSHKENITQALNRMSNAFDLISHDHQISKLYKQFSESFTIWQSKTEAVLAKIVIPSKRKFALKGSNGGSAEKTFTAMRHIVDKMQQRVEQMIVEQKQIIANNRAAIEAERESVLVKRDMIIAEKRSIDEKKSLGTTNFLKVKSTIESINTTFYSLAIISLIISIIAAVMIGNDW